MCIAAIVMMAACPGAGGQRSDNQQGVQVRIGLPTPYLMREIAVTLEYGEQRELRGPTLCAESAVNARQWKASLERAGYVVEIGEYVIGHPGYLESFAVRFRKGRVFGDLLSTPESPLCSRPTIRLQVSSGVGPDRWRIPSSFLPPIHFPGRPPPRPMFESSPAYPEEYESKKP